MRINQLHSLISSLPLFLFLFFLNLPEGWSQNRPGENLWGKSGAGYRLEKIEKRGPDLTQRCPDMVYRLTKESQTYFAKCIHKATAQKYQNESFELIRTLNDPNLAEKATQNYVYLIHEILEDDVNFCYITRGATGGTLFDFLKQKKDIELEWKKKTFRQIVEGVLFLHELGYCHRDIKLENIFLDGAAFVSDFDLSFRICDNCTLFNGTTPYKAPEILSRKPHDCKKSDAWSLGVVLYSMLTGNFPFGYDGLTPDEDPGTTITKVLPPEEQANATNLILKLLDDRPDARMTVPEILDHPFLKSSRG